MKKGIYFILAFMFCVESAPEKLQNQYKDRKLIINNEGITIQIFPKCKKTESSKGQEIQLIGVNRLVKHLYNNGHIIFKNEVVKNISDLKQIVTDRYKRLKKVVPEVVQARPIISYMKLNGDCDGIRWMSVIIDRIFGRIGNDSERTVNIKVINNKDNIIEIEFEAVDTRNWYYVNNKNEVWKLVIPQIRVVLKKTVDTWFIATAYASTRGLE